MSKDTRYLGLEPAGPHCTTRQPRSILPKTEPATSRLPSEASRQGEARRWPCRVQTCVRRLLVNRDEKRPSSD